MLQQSSAYNLRKRPSNVPIFVLWLSSSLHFGGIVRYINDNSKFCCFSAYCSRPLKQSRLDFSNPKETFFRIQLTEIDSRKSLFSDVICTKVKLLGLSSHTTVDWKQQRCKCTMVYLKDSFILGSVLFLFIHNMAVLQGLVPITTGVGVENPLIEKCLLPSFPETSSPDIYLFLVWIVWCSTLQSFSRYWCFI